MNGLIVLLSSILGGALTATVAALASRKRTTSEAQHIEAQAVDVISRAAADFVERSAAMAIKNEARLEQKIGELEGSVADARRELLELRSVVVALSAQLTAAGITPITQADPWRT